MTQRNPATRLHRSASCAGTLLALAISGCAAGSNAVTLPGGPGAITLSIEGFTGGASGKVVITAPGGDQDTVTTSGVIDDLALGVYQLQPLVSQALNHTWNPSEGARTLVLDSQQPTATVAFHYQLATGALDLRVAGLPTTTDPAVRITGPSGFVLNLVGSATLRGLAPGTYQLTAMERVIGTAHYLPSDSSTTVSITPSLVPVAVEFAYARKTAALMLNVTGVPDGALAQIAISSTTGYQAVISATTTVGTLDPGSYTAMPLDISWQGHTWQAETPQVTFSVDTGSVQLDVNYRIVTGALTLDVSGLPDGAAAEIEVWGPAEFSRTASGPESFVGLVPGVYSIFPRSFWHNGRRWTPRGGNRDFTVPPGRDGVRGEVDYDEATGSLRVTMVGLPNGAQGRVVVLGPEYVDTVTSTRVLGGLEPGNYTLSAENVTAGSNTFGAAPALQNAAVTSADTAARTVQYGLVTQPNSGVLLINVNGAPAGGGDVTVTGPNGFTRRLTATTSITSLAPGTYTISALGVTAGGSSYVATPGSQTAAVSNGSTVTRSVGYAVAAPTTGNLAINVSGLPGGAAAAITVSGPGGYSQSVTAAGTISGLAVGSYTVTAQAVSAGGTTYSGVPVSQTVWIAAGATASRSVSYSAAAPTTGGLTITISGLPSGAQGDVTVTGAGGYSRTLTGTTAITNLAPGTYTITAAAVAAGGNNHVPTPASQTASVVAGNTTSRSVGYAVAAPTTGALTVTISGLPGGVAGGVVVTGPNGYSQAVSSTTTLSGLPVGSYTVTASTVSSSGNSWTATPASQSAWVAAGATASRAVSYALVAPTNGALALTVSGLPGGTAAAITVTGPGGYSQAVTSGGTLGNLAAGSYTITATTVSAGGSSYLPTPTTQTASVTAGNTTSRTVAYAVAAPTTGGLALTISGLPGGGAAAVSVTGPGNYAQAVTATGTLGGLAAGSYTIAAQNVTIGGTQYAPAPTSQSAAVTAGDTAARSVAYTAVAPTTGALTVTVTGLPGGAAAAVTVTGPGGYSQAVTGTTTLNGLAEGSYVVAASAVTSGGQGYGASPASQNVWVAAGATASRTVTYASTGGGGGGGGGNATISVDTTTRFQVMTGWEATDQAGQESAGYSSWRSTLMTQAADLGINRIRLELRAGAENTVDYWTRLRNGTITNAEWNSHRYAPVNDNSSATSANLSGFQFSELNHHVEQVVLPLKQAVEARGGQLYVSLNYIGFGTGTAVHQTPAEYAEFILVAFQHLQSRYGLVPNAVEAILEPDNTTQFNATEVAAMIVAAGDRLAAAGFRPDFVGPSTMSMANAPTWLDQMASTPRLFTYLKELSYHRYTGVSDANLTAIRSRAAARGIRTAMLEHMGSGVEALYKDLTLANASAWQQFALAFPTSDNGAQYFTISGTTVTMGSRTKLLRQYFRYVPFGAQRVAATSASGGVRPVAFLNPNGGMAVVLHIDATGSYSVAGLRPGTYTVEITSTSGTRTSLPTVTATPGGSVSVSPATTGVLTLSRVP